MNWLYCRDGVVIAWHDPHLNYPPELYGDGVTIIPYDEPLSTLDRVGTPLPESAGRDIRPYAAPTITGKDQLVAYAKMRKQLAAHHATSLAEFEQAFATLKAVLDAIAAAKITTQAQVDDPPKGIPTWPQV